MEKKMTRIKNISLILKWTFGLYLVLLPLGSLFFWVISAYVPWEGNLLSSFFEPGFLDITIKAAGETYHIHKLNLSLDARLIGFLGDLCLYSFKWIAVLYVFHLMSLYGAGDLFSKKHAHYFKRIGQFFLLYGTIGMTLGDSLHSIAVTFANPPGQRLITFGFGSPNIMMLAMASVITLIGWITLEGFKLRADQELTI